MTARTEAAGVAGVLAVLADALADADNGRVASVYGSTAGINERRLREQAALATLQSRLLAADELREAVKALPLDIADMYVSGEARADEYDDWKDGTAALSEALAAYDKAGTT